MLHRGVVGVARLQDTQAQAHDRPALDLAFYQRQVDRSAHVVGLGQLGYPDLAGDVVHFHLRHATRVGDGGVRDPVRLAGARVGETCCSVGGSEPGSGVTDRPTPPGDGFGANRRGVWNRISFSTIRMPNGGYWELNLPAELGGLRLRASFHPRLIGLPRGVGLLSRRTGGDLRPWRSRRPPPGWRRSRGRSRRRSRPGSTGPALRVRTAAPGGSCR